MLFGPCLVHITGAHGFVGAFHAHSADVDMTCKHGHHQYCGHRMHHVCDLHAAALIHQARNDFVEHKTRGHHDGTQGKHTQPKNHFFARIETVRRHFFATQNATAFEQPSEVAFRRQVVFHKSDEHHHQ